MHSFLSNSDMRIIKTSYLKKLYDTDEYIINTSLVALKHAG